MRPSRDISSAVSLPANVRAATRQAASATRSSRETRGGRAPRTPRAPPLPRGRGGPAAPHRHPRFGLGHGPRGRVELGHLHRPLFSPPGSWGWALRSAGWMAQYYTEILRIYKPRGWQVAGFLELQ